MELLLNHLREDAEFHNLLKTLQVEKNIPGMGLVRAARLPLLAAIHRELNQPILILTDRADHALSVFDELGFWATGASRYLFSEPNPLFYEEAAWGNATRRQRLQALTVLAGYHLPFVEKPASAPIIVASARSVMTRTIPGRDFLKACKRLKVGQEIQPDVLIHQWADTGYQASEIVVEPGQFTRRGGILDIWVTSDEFPARLDFFGDEIDTIRRFDPASQRTIAKLETLLITPAREYIVNEAFRNSQTEGAESSEFHIPLLHSFPASILDYLPQNGLVCIYDLSLCETIVSEVEEQAVKFRHESITEGSLPETFPVPYLTWSEVLDSIQHRKWIDLGYSEQLSEGHPIKELFGHDQRFGGRLKPFVEYLDSLIAQGDKVIIVSRQRDRLEELWNDEFHLLDEVDGERSETDPEIMFIEASLSEGWVLGPASHTPIHLITDSEIFGWDRPTSRSTGQKPAAEAPESAYADLHAGDYVVHVDYGIGKFIGLVHRVLEKHEREFLAIEYEGGDQIYVPVFQADRLTRYVGTEGGTPNVTRLGTQEWSNAKANVKEAVKKIAQELLELYAQRQTIRGYAFKPDTQWQKELEGSFPYVETPDQVQAIAAIKRDMETPRPMDRLLCGDVGYGKTEVALRAAFKAVQDGKQVAILVPTTVLAQQHYETFMQRLAAFPVTVEMLSRFRTPREQTEILRRLLLGQVDIIIGTHRLISQDVEFKNLGLVVIDEEQRFGVTHKEHLKKLRTEVDVLTLTATPIPRTLYMALAGVRDISNLNTPPDERLPVITHIGPYSPRLVRQAVLRELERGGQIFFVHNRVQTIHAMKLHLQKLVPEARIGIGHGQLDEKELASVMHQFTEAKIDILLCTTIIESGLDIPNANTLIIDRADTFGLAQLYQLRGRVGRAASRAYAYFFRHRKKTPTLEGQERLEVIAENTQLGAGYSIAMRDLEIRGAGELLGMRQSGHITSVGFHLYTRLLASEVKKMRRIMIAVAEGKMDGSFVQQKEGDAGTQELINSLTPILNGGGPFSSFEDELKEPVTVDLPLEIGIPSSFIPNQDMRLRLYRRLAALRDESELEPLMAEFTDRFGPLPDMFQNLFFQMKVKMAADAAGLLSVSTEAGQIVLKYPVLTESMSQRMLSDLGSSIRGGKNAYWCNFLKDSEWQERLMELLQRLKNRVITVTSGDLPVKFAG